MELRPYGNSGEKTNNDSRPINVSYMVFSACLTAEALFQIN